jgi:hypothetical protein
MINSSSEQKGVKMDEFIYYNLVLSLFGVFGVLNIKYTSYVVPNNSHVRRH